MVKTRALVLGTPDYGVPFDLMGWECSYVDTDHAMPSRDHYENADIILFTGGADVSPSLSGDMNTDSHCDPLRDLIEVGVYLEARRLRIPTVGICRGSQFLRRMNGGSLTQHINNHGLMGEHTATFVEDVVWCAETEKTPPPIMVTSTHHQTAIPALQGEHFVDLLYGDSDGTPSIEAWVLDHWYVAGVQYHPEYMDHDSDGMVFFQDLCRGMLGDDTVQYYIEP